MTGDYASKPLQGALFKDFRDQMMGATPVKVPGDGKTPKVKIGKSEAKKAKKNGPTPVRDVAPQECVGGHARVRVGSKNG